MSRILSVVAGYLVWACAAGIDAEGLVGDCGDFSRLEVRGAQTFTADDIRTCLRTNLEAVVASHPVAPLTSLPATVSRRLLEGFHSDGFADAQIRTEIDNERSRLIATVSEGPRYRNGCLRIDGVKLIDVNPSVAEISL
ncbi:MAG: hypothetical protein FJ276_10095 [Planctomycetes bacterium]|nr:hypothetical protein [Planctomycetota bacterium]